MGYNGLMTASLDRCCEEFGWDGGAPLRALMEALPVAVCLGECRGAESLVYRPTMNSASLESLMGLSIGDLAERPGGRLTAIHPDDLENFLKAMRHAAERRRDVEVEYRIHHQQQDRYLWIHERACAVPGANAESVTVLSVLIDISRFRAAEEKAQTSDDRMRVLVEGTPYLFFYTQDENADVTYVSPSVERITGHAVEDWLGQRHWWVTESELNERAKERTEAHLRGEFTAGPSVIEVEHADGHSILLEVFENPIVREGQLIGIQGVAHDVTERHRLQKALGEAQRVEAIGRLAAGLAHDINNMLQGIMMSAELMAQDPADTPAARRRLAEIINLCEQGRDLIRQLLAYSRRQSLEFKAVNLNEVVAELAPIMERLVGDHIKVTLELEPSLPLVSADKSQLVQVLLNLTANARDAIRVRGRIHYRTAYVDASDAVGGNPKLRDGLVRLQVADSGCGITKENLPYVFDPFFTTKDRDRGTGLGLASVLGTVKQHGGWVDVDTDPTRGTTFTLTLPALPANGRRGDPRSKGRQVVMHTGRREHVLVVEDRADLLETMVELMTRLGYEVSSAGSVAEARTVVGTVPELDALVTDLQLPDGLALDLIPDARGRFPNMAVVLMSGYGPGGIVNAEDQLPPDVVFLAKPFSIQTLAQTLWNVLHQGE